jgi:hypothetical protein
MYKFETIDVTPRTAGRLLTLPIRILVCLTPDSELFNPFRMMDEVFGRWAANRAGRVFVPKVYAPQIPLGELRARLGAPLKDNAWYVEHLSFTAWQRFDIVHIAGFINEIARGLANSLALGSLMRSSKTRLLILQTTRDDFPEACDVGRSIVKGRGPTVLAVGADPRQGLPEYLIDIYGGIVHNESLDTLSQSRSYRTMDATLLAGRDGQLLLRLDPIRQQLEDRVREVERSHAERRYTVDNLNDSFRRLHRSQRAIFDGPQSVLQKLSGSAYNNRITRALNVLDWSHESSGAIPLAETMDLLDAAETEAREFGVAAETTRQKADAIAAMAPRVLNSNFASSKGKPIPPSNALRPESEYDLMVDIGPRWDTIPSLVVGNAEFPETALPDSFSGGTKLRVVAVSGDFSPPIVSAFISLPFATGRSRPWESSDPGPVHLRLRTPKSGDLHGKVRLRLSIYYEGNLLQSGVLTATVQSDDTVLETPNSLAIDYVLSGSFQDLPDAFAQRDLVLPGQTQKNRRSSIALNLTLNDDGAAGHRIVVLADEDQQAAFLPYDPIAGGKQMDRARQTLLDLFFEKTDRGAVTERPGLQSDNGKALAQFKQDLYILAILGRQLLQGAFAQALVEGKPNEIAINYLNGLESRLLDASLIQVARTGPAQYVFPWALLYSHPLTGDADTWSFCSVIGEQWIGGRRTGGPLSRCPHNLEKGDHENVICPFGFWGLRHIIEQPLSALVRKDGGYALTNAISSISAGATIKAAVARTGDSAMAAAVDAHLAQLALNVASKYNPPKGATSATEAAKVFQESELVYILCHGKYDDLRYEPYLGIGDNDGRDEHRIYPTTIQDWGTKTCAPTLSSWPQKRPLVIVNGCHTCDLKPGEMLNIVSALNTVGAGGVVGTEVSVQLPIALEMANNFLRYLLPTSGLGVGEALYRARWDLANKGNLFGLAYTAYCKADLKFVVN